MSTPEATEANTKSMTVQGVALNVKVPYAAGRVVNEAEASTLNQTFVENIRNNTASKIKAAIKAWLAAEPAEGEEAHTEDNFVAGDELITSIQSYADSYEFGVKRLSNLEPVDPVQKEATKIARELLNGKLKAAGYKVKDIPEDKYDALLAAMVAKDEVQKEAKRRVKVAETVGNEELDLSGLADVSAPVAGGEGEAQA